MCLSILLAATGPARAEISAAEAQQFIREGIARSIELIKSRGMPRQDIAAKLHRDLQTNFDVPAISVSVLGGARAAQLTEDQRRRFQREFEELIVQTYTGRILLVGSKVDARIDDVLKVTEAIPAGNERMLVRSQVNRTAATWINIDWLMHKKDGKLRILDVVFVGISQAELYRSEFAAVMERNGGIEGLIEALHKKNEVMMQAER